MIVLRSIVIAFACFSVIPMPRVDWDARNMRYMMAAFPLVGVVVGAGLMLWWTLCAALGVGTVLQGAGLALMPIIVTGGIHMDGLADVTDALSSHASPERKRAILKDPHVGAFAVLGVGCYLLASFALCCELTDRLVPLVACCPSVSRCLVGYVAVCAPTASDKGMLASMHQAAHTKVVRGLLVAQLVLAGAVLVWLNPSIGALALAAAVLVVAWATRMANREFGGMSGDLSGFCLQMVELFMLMCVVFAGKVW